MQSKCIVEVSYPQVIFLGKSPVLAGLVFEQVGNFERMDEGFSTSVFQVVKSAMFFYLDAVFGDTQCFRVRSLVCEPGVSTKVIHVIA